MLTLPPPIVLVGVAPLEPIMIPVMLTLEIAMHPAMFAPADTIVVRLIVNVFQPII